jgi:hypothetical protein
MDGDDDGDEDDKKEDDDEDDEDESKAKKAAAAAKYAKKAAEAAKHRAKAADHKQKAAEYEEAAKKAEEDEDDEEESEEEAAARIESYAPSDAVSPRTSSNLSPGAAAAIASEAQLGRDALARLTKLEKSAEKREHAALITEARAARRITGPEAKSLASKSIGFVRDFLDMRPKALVATEEDDLVAPKGGDSDGGPVLTSEQMVDIDAAVRATGAKGDAASKLKADMVTNARKELSSLNGAGRY